jgi:hypothetical protein
MSQLTSIEHERLQEIEALRNETFSNQDFINWYKEMRIATRVDKTKLNLDRHHFETEKTDFQFKF